MTWKTQTWAKVHVCVKMKTRQPYLRECARRSVDVVASVRIVKCHASIDIVIGIRIVECHASIHVVIGIHVVLCHPLIAVIIHHNFSPVDILHTFCNEEIRHLRCGIYRKRKVLSDRGAINNVAGECFVRRHDRTVAISAVKARPVPTMCSTDALCQFRRPVLEVSSWKGWHFNRRGYLPSLSTRLTFSLLGRLVQKCMDNAGHVLYSIQKRTWIAGGPTTDGKEPGLAFFLPVAMLTWPKVKNSRSLTVNHLDQRERSWAGALRPCVSPR